MIKKYKQFNESIKNLLVGPTEEEILNNLKTKYNNGSFGIIEFHRQCVINKITGGPTNNDVMRILMENELKGLLKSIPNSAEDFFNKMKDDCYKMYSNGHGDVYGKNEIALFVVDHRNKILYFSDDYIMNGLNYFYGYEYGYIKIQRMVKPFLVNSSWENYTPVSCTKYITLKTS